MQTLDLLDTRYAFFSSYGFIYIFYVRHLFYLKPDVMIFLPNPMLLIFTITVGVIMATCSQELDHQDVVTRKILNLHLLGLIPSFLLVKIIGDVINEEKAKGNDDFLVLSFRIMRFLVIFFSLVFTGLFVFIVGTGDFRILLVMIYMSLGLGGYSIGYELSRIRENPNKSIEFILLYGIGPVIGTSKRRKIFVFIILIIVVILLNVNIGDLFPMIIL